MPEKTTGACYYRDNYDPPAPDVFLQWKGMETCMDFHCECGASAHVHANFAYYLKCWKCGAVYEMPHTVALRRLADGEEPQGFPVLTERDPMDDEEATADV